MKNLLTLLLLAVSIHVSAQITIDKNDMPSSGDMIRLSTAPVSSTVDLTQTGTNFTWDFTTLVPDSQVVDSFLTVSSTGFTYALYFSALTGNPASFSQHGPSLSALPGIPVTDPYVFFYKTNSLYEQVGFGATLSGIQIPVAYNNKDVIYNFPLNYNDADSSDSDFSVALAGTGSLSGNQHRVNHVDGWGSLQTAYGTFDVLRVVSQTTGHDSVYLDTLSTGFGFDQLLTREYKWIGKNQSLPLLQITTQEVGGLETVTAIRYRDSLRVIPIPTEIVKNENDVSEMKLSPNPTNETSVLRFVSPNCTTFLVKVLDIAGREINASNFAVSKGKNEIRLSSINMKNGMYVIQLYQEGKVLKRISWMISK